MVCFCLECWVFFRKFLKRHRHFVLVSFCFWFDSNLNNWFWEFHRLQNNWVVYIGKRVTSCSVFQTNCGSDISREYFRDFFPRVCVHLQDTSNTFPVIFRCVQHVRSRFKCSGINAEECQTSNKWVCHNFKCQCSKWFAVVCVVFNYFFWVVYTVSLNCWDFKWRWEIVNYCVKQQLNTFVFKCRSTEHWVEVNIHCTFTNYFFQF